MGTFTWLTQSESLSGDVGQRLLPVITLACPAGAIIKRFQLRQCRHSSVQTGIGYNTVGPGQWAHNVQVGRYGHAVKQCFSAIAGIPTQQAALYDFATTQRVYTQYTSSGDHELGFNQGCSYGKHTDPSGPYMIYTGEIDGFQALAPQPQGQLDYTFAVLYEIL